MPGPPNQILVGDGDGDRDVAVALGNDVGRLLNDGGVGAHLAPLASIALPDIVDLALADLDGDGADEILVTGSDPWWYSVDVRKPGSMSARCKRICSGDTWVTDVDGDGIDDLLFHASAQENHGFLCQMGCFGLAALISPMRAQSNDIGYGDQHERPLDVGDVDGDRRADLLIPDGFAVELRKNLDAVAFQAGSSVLPDYGWTTVRVGHFHGSSPELVFAAKGGSLRIHRTDHGGSFTSGPADLAHPTPALLETAAIRDLDADDIVAAGPEWSGDIRVLRGCR